MRSLENARLSAFSLPEVTEEPHFDVVSWRIRGKIFATIPPEPDRLRVFVDETETAELVAAKPSVFEPLLWGGRVRGVTVRLDAAAADDVSEVLETAWRRRAPKRLVAAYDALRAAGR